MMTAALVLFLAGPGAPSPTPTPKATPAPALSRTMPAGSGPSDLSSYAGKVKVDRSKADTIFKADGPPVAVTPAVAIRTPARSSAEKGEPTPPSGDEARWRERAASLRRDLDLAREELATTERNLPAAANTSQGTAQRSTLLYPYQVAVDRAQAALDALSDECRQSPGCQPGWVR